jgi:hypothetical protein
MQTAPRGETPEKISVSRLPITGSDVFGREEEIAFLDHAWANKEVNVVTIVAWAGVGKSTLVNHWLRQMAAEHYRSAEVVFGWSFYRQGTTGKTSSADEFLDAALSWFGDPDPRLGTAWEKGERLAKLVAHRRTLLILDGLEPLQNPPGPQEGRLREPSLQALLRELAAFNMGLCVITTQVAAGLAAVHEQNLVHRDMKPSNIMVRLKDGGGITAKIIDLGLAKVIAKPSFQTAISTPGGFVGTPEFASPEQFAGLALDTRSDLYSLGVTLWESLTGKTPFRGTSGEMVYQHQHTPLPLEELEGVPQPLVVLLETLLEKDPGRRFQNPGELLKAIPTITGRIEAGRRITRDNLHKMPPAASRTGTRKPPVRQGPKKISVAKLPVTGSDLFGREEDIALLDDAWANKDSNVVTVVAWAGATRRLRSERMMAVGLVVSCGSPDEQTRQASVKSAGFLKSWRGWCG